MNPFFKRGTRGALGAATGAALIASLFAATACGKQCDRNPDELPVTWNAGTTTNPGRPSASYESAGWSGPYLDFPAGRTYRFNHALGDCPKTILIYGAFNPSPVVTTNSGHTSAGSAIIIGNQANVTRVTSTTFDVRNDTCSDVFIRAEASDPGSSGCTSFTDAAVVDARPVTDRAAHDAGQ